MSVAIALCNNEMQTTRVGQQDMMSMTSCNHKLAGSILGATHATSFVRLSTSAEQLLFIGFAVVLLSTSVFTCTDSFVIAEVGLTKRTSALAVKA